MYKPKPSKFVLTIIRYFNILKSNDAFKNKPICTYIMYITVYYVYYCIYITDIHILKIWTSVHLYMVQILYGIYLYIYIWYRYYMVFIYGTFIYEQMYIYKPICTSYIWNAQLFFRTFEHTARMVASTYI